MNKLRKKRKELGITQLQAANACGVSLRTYQTYEETNNENATFNALLKKLEKMDALDGSNVILGIGKIKKVCRQVFKEKYPEIKCAYLFGSYARKEATCKSDVDVVVVLDKPMGLRFFGIAGELEKELNKTVDLLTYEQLIDNASLLKDVLTEGIKIYG